MIRVLLVDDNAIVRRGIASLLAEADGIEVVGEAADGREAIAVAREAKPDVVCLDVRMPVMDGVAAAKPLSESAKVLMLSYSEDEPLVTGAISNGASGYLVHGRFDPDELESRIKAIARGEMVLSPAVTPAVFDALRRAPGSGSGRRRLRYRPARCAGVHMAVIRVLLVDDNAIVRRGIASLLAEADGIEVVGEAGDGREAIAVARETRPDVVCLDVRMPVDAPEAAAAEATAPTDTLPPPRSVPGYTWR